MLVCLSSKSSIHPLFLAQADGELEMCISQEIVLEYVEIFGRYRGATKANEIMSILMDLPKLHYVRVYYYWDLLAIDVDDNKFVDCAIAANADYIITVDRHFDVLHSIDFPTVVPIGALDFIQKFLKS